MKSKKQALAKSVLALLLCVAMLVGTTFAWFTDSVVSGINTIQAGNLDVELYHSNAAVSDKAVNANTELFLDLNGEDILWEPGVVSYENLTVANEGDLALVYRMAINTDNENFIVDGANRYGLSQVLKVGLVKGGITATDRKGVVESVSSWTTLGSFLQSGALLPDGTDTVGIVIYWYPSDNDNNWNLNNGKTLSEGTALSIDLGVNLTATQAEHESDFFGTDYDVIAGDEVFPDINGGTDGVIVKVGLDNRTTEEVVLTAGDVTITVPAGVLVNSGVEKLNAIVSDVNSSEANINLESNDAVRSLDVHVEGVSKDNDVPLTVNMPEALPTGLNMGNYELYHVEDGATNEMTLVTEFSAHNQFTYDPATGDVVLYMQSFSEVAMVANASAAWEGQFDYSWYTPGANTYTIANADQLAAFGAIVGGMKKVTGISGGKYTYGDFVTPDPFTGKTVNLINNVNISELDSENGRTFYPVGYYNEEGTYEKSGVAIVSGLRNFEGTFDGQGHVVSNFYQNTWEMKGDHDWYAAADQHYRDGMGLFGRVYKGTVKNLTVENFSSDGEITTTGVIAAYADGAKFENIALFNCNPRVYNIGNGGIVGCVGWYAKEADLKTTFTNITVDNTNKISALWGSYDVACGGIVGQYYPTSGQTSAGSPKNAGIHFENCHIAAQMDVYNDVCGNYQYYAYRYAGILMGSVRENVTIDGREYPKMDGITANNCTVHFGTWNDYFYCEFEKNGHPSYSGPDDYKFSRVPNSEIDTSNGKENATCIGHNHTAVEDNQAIYLPFNNLVTGYGWGVTSKGVEDMDGVEILDRDEGNSVEKWTGKGLGTILNKTSYKLMDLFKATNSDVEILNGNVTVSVSNLNAGNPVSITKFTRNTSDWSKSTFELDGVGQVQITIQDYYFCQPTTITVNVKNPPVPSIPSNKTQNGDFEVNSTSAWKQDVWFGTKQITSADSKTGNNSLYVVGTGDWNGLVGQNISVENGKTYTLSFWYKSVENGFQWSIIGKTTSTKYASGSVNKTSWTRVSVDIPVNGDNTLFLAFSSNNGNGKIEKFYIDEVMLVEKESITNGCFEFGKVDWAFNSGSAIMEIDDTHGGNYALRVSSMESQHGYGEAAVSKAITVDTNKVYIVRWWSKRLSGSGAFNLITIGKVDKVGGQEWMNETSGNWVENFYIFKPTVSSIQMKLTSEVDNYADPGTILFDDVTIEEVEYDGYVVDGNFKLGLKLDWKTYGNTKVTSEAAHDGQYGLKLDHTASWAGSGYLNFKTEKDAKYRVTMWVKTVNNGMNIAIQNVNGNTATNIPNTGIWFTNTEWTKKVLEFTAQGTTTRINFNCGEAVQRYTVYADEITVEKIG